jgi:hypothetical protein
MSDSSKQTNRVAILAAVIGGACTILAALIGLSVPVVERLMNAQSSVQPTPAQPTSVPGTIPVGMNTSPTNLEAEKAAVMNAINLVGIIEAQALFDLDPTPLNKIFSGEALKIETTIIDNLKKNNQYYVSVRHNIRYEEINISSDGTQTEAYVVPTWEIKLYSSATKQCVAYIPPTELPQTIYLEKTSSGWIITAIAYDDSQESLWVACPN